MDRKELRLGNSTSTLGRVPIWEVTINDAGKELGRTIVCEMNAFHPEWREYAGRFVEGLNARRA